MSSASAQVQLVDFATRKGGRSEGHDYTAAILLRSGAAEVSISHRFTLRARELYVIPAGAPHAFFCAKEGTKGWGFRLTGDFKYLNRCKLVATLDEEPFRDLESWLSRIHLEQREATSCSVALREALLQAVQIECARAMGVGSCAEYPLLVRRVLAIVEAEYTARLRPRDVAARVGVTPAHLSHELRRLTGRSPSEWIAHTRIQAAKRYLLLSNERVCAIAAAVGYSDVSQLNRQFRREVGLSPHAWRARRDRGQETKSGRTQTIP